MKSILKISSLFLILLSNVAFAQTQNEKKAIEATVRGYLEGKERLKEVFHESATLLSVRDGKVAQMKASDWIAKVMERVEAGVVFPEQKKKILSLDYETNVANVKVEIKSDNSTSYDYLGLAKTENGWKIVTKMYYYKSN